MAPLVPTPHRHNKSSLTRDSKNIKRGKTLFLINISTDNVSIYLSIDFSWQFRYQLIVNGFIFYDTSDQNELDTGKMFVQEL